MGRSAMKQGCRKVEAQGQDLGVGLGIDCQDSEELLLTLSTRFHEGNVSVEGAIQVQLRGGC